MPRRQKTGLGKHLAQQKAENVHLRKAKTEGEVVALLKARDRELPMPKLILHSLQGNIRGGRLPKPEENGKRYVKIPFDAFEAAAWD